MSNMVNASFLLSDLVEQGVLKDFDAERVQGIVDAKGTRVSKILLSLGLISEGDLQRRISVCTGIELFEEELYRPDMELLSQLDIAFVREARLFPVLSERGESFLVLDDPLDHFPVKAMRLKFQREFDLLMAPASLIDQMIEGLSQTAEEAVTEIGGSEGPESRDLSEDIGALEDLASEEPVVIFLNELLQRAHREKASDIHIECDGQKYDVRLRVDSFLKVYGTVSVPIGRGIVSRIKILAKMDISEQRLPQDGRIKTSLNGKAVDLRVSSIPAIFGEGVVLRLLDKSGGVIPLDDLGYREAQQAIIERALSKPEGIILLTGPTGSGKTTTLYSLLNQLIDPNRKIVTVEDPVEYQFEGLMQVPVQAQIGLDFNTVLRSVLRHDPDTLMIGEIRDAETAQIAIRASLTGHLVLSSLHANSTVATATRLIDMGVERYLVSSTLSMIVAQRLLRLLCDKCKIPDDVSNRRNAVDSGPYYSKTYFKACGCHHCHQTGYQGRIAVAEILELDDELRSALIDGASEAELTKLAQSKGMISLKEEAMEKAKAGLTSLLEVQRVLGESAVVRSGAIDA
ncbi:GspE/PulE family protein [Kiloniella litopenaei]|uniref:GspE/PulE family protein n=1 Tax=Kiloniella litopenaei TaxID=1549748 RepID=UPI003BAC7710